MPKVDGGYLRKAASPVYRYNPDFMAYRCREISEKLKKSWLSRFSGRVCLLVLADKTNNNALLALVPIKGDSNCVTSIPTAPCSDVLL